MREASRGPGAPPEGAGAWCARFLSTTRANRLLLASARSALGRAWWRWVETRTLRGVVSHWMRRKREIDRFARSAAADGFTQLLVLGAGLDTLAFRLSEEPVFERVISADHPATLQVIRDALARSVVVSRVELVALDLLHSDLCAVITATGAFDPARATLVVIEGVLMYLPEASVEAVLRAVCALPVPRVRLIASWMVADPGEPIGFHGQSRAVPAWLRKRREPMLWGSTPAALPTFLEECGWSATRLIDLDTDEPRQGAESRGLRSEKLAIAERRLPA